MNEQHVSKFRRKYNRLAANQTMEDYALRFTAKSGRLWSVSRVSNTALGAISFLALEAIGGAITLRYGFDNTVIAVMVVSLIIFLTSLPISYYAARYGVDIDLLTRGAGFGYIGSTITSLIYASFTFIFFAIEAAIMSLALEMLFDIPLSIAYLLSSLMVIPLATHGITFISRFQLWSQPLWLVLQILPFVFILYYEWSAVEDWTNYKGTLEQQQNTTGFNLIFFGAASGVIFSLIAQIGEQVDFLRFLPEKNASNSRRWWLALISAGPGWIIVGAIKILAGSFLVVLAINHGIPEELADNPTQMYLIAFSFLTDSPNVVLALTGIFVIISQLKINVTNAYAGSIAWSNFFSRLTHSHPGRVVWLVFNVTIALLLMELGIYEALEHILGVYANVAVAWVGALVADLVINKPLGYSPKHIEFKRAHLYDINPVGFGAMLIASVAGIVSYTGVFGELAHALSPYISLVTAFIVSPIIAIYTKGKYYIARKSNLQKTSTRILTCTVCQNDFETEDMTSCPAYGGAICSLCCSLDGRCHDQCKAGARFNDQLKLFINSILPHNIAAKIDNRLLQFVFLLSLISSLIATVFWLVYQQVPNENIEANELITSAMKNVFVLLMIIVGVLVWLFVLATESRQFALEESQRQTHLLSKEIKAHGQTGQALQEAMKTADSANLAKSRYLIGISHELRSPLNTILGYTQLLEKDQRLLEDQEAKLTLIHRSGEHLNDLIEGMLDISRIEAGRIELRRDQLPLKMLVDDLAEMFSMQADAKDLTFEYDVTNQIPDVVIGDEKRLRQILINLLSNAIKYTQSGGVTFSVIYRNQVAKFIISDTGVGIGTEDKELIFQPFERIRTLDSPQIPGVGLGLTISKFFAEIMGGEITLQSEHGKGSSFQLSLMLPNVSEPTLRTEVIRRIASYEGSKKTIMVVDDEPSHRGLISEILLPLNFDVLEASDAYNCLEGLEDKNVDLFLLDISMPGMNGWQLVKVLRNRGIKTPIIMVSADAFESPENNPKNQDVDADKRLHNDYLTKPINDNLLLDKIANVLGLRWTYETEKGLLKNKKTEPKDKPDLTTLFSGIKKSDCHELISMAEIGYIQGIEKILTRMDKLESNQELVKRIRKYVKCCKFAKIISLAEKGLDS
ncbi:hybrid sensor histidine kinase/response regulator [Cocleimonas flava]|uniref:histidine kinase n=1 Tax=Cocleimonas flava TaxID=634765 RepID=A0A4R1FAX9_9GAMM|nr:ATP-binding protein [Cocleimonas flava]TCJ89098.1 signal transduction histidine kinase [Cocleimonas flava]